VLYRNCCIIMYHCVIQSTACVRPLNSIQNMYNAYSLLIIVTISYLILLSVAKLSAMWANSPVDHFALEAMAAILLQIMCHCQCMIRY